MILKLMYPFENINQTMEVLSWKMQIATISRTVSKVHRCSAVHLQIPPPVSGQTENLCPRVCVTSPDPFLRQCLLNTWPCTEHFPWEEPLFTMRQYLTTEGNSALKSWSNGAVTHISVFNLEIPWALPQSPAKAYSCFSMSFFLF